MDKGICEPGCKGLIGVHMAGEMGGKEFQGKRTAFAVVYIARKHQANLGTETVSVAQALI